MARKNGTRETLEIQKFYHRAVMYLREEFPEKTKDMSDSDLKDDIFESCSRALEYGLDTQENAMAFVDLEWRFVKNFDSNPETTWAKDVLYDDDFDAQMKIETLRNAFMLADVMEDLEDAF